MSEQQPILVPLSPQHAEILAVVAKRLGYADLIGIAESGSEAYRMGFALAMLRQRLAEVGIEVR